jgi:hypothetical protein
MDLLYASASDVLILENFAPESRNELMGIARELREARKVRSGRVFDAVRAQTIERLAESDGAESELRALNERKNQLKKEMERLAVPPVGEMSSERLIEDAKRELREAHAESLHSPVELVECRMVELQVRIDSETR